MTCISTYCEISDGLTRDVLRTVLSVQVAVLHRTFKVETKKRWIKIEV